MEKMSVLRSQFRLGDYAVCICIILCFITWKKCPFFDTEFLSANTEFLTDRPSFFDRYRAGVSCGGAEGGSPSYGTSSYLGSQPRHGLLGQAPLGRVSPGGPGLFLPSP